jgi:hypothetical protein
MLKKTITYDDYNGNSITEDFYFNLTKAELIELELSEKDGLAKMMQEIVDSQDGKRIVDTFKRIILLAYGKKSEDGRRFLKSEELRTEFSQTEAYSDLFMELATDAASAAAFVTAIVPSSTGMAPDVIDNVVKGIVTKPVQTQEAPVLAPAPLPTPLPTPLPAPAPTPDKAAREMSREELLHALSLKQGETPEQ